MKNIKSPLKWFGGKYYLSKYILPFPKHISYIEVFGGGASLLFHKIPSLFETYNDINERVVNFWKIIKEKYLELQFLLKWKGDLDSRKLYEKYKEKSDDSLEDAFRFFYVNRHSFSGRNDTYHGISFNNIKKHHEVYLNIIDKFDQIYKRIKNVHFECQDFRILLKRCDEPNALLYLDPPYFQGGEQYEKMIGGQIWTEKNIEDLSLILKNLKKSMFVLSIDKKDCFMNEDWFYETISRTNHASKSKKRTKSREYIIRNFDPSKMQIMKPFTQKDLGNYIKKTI